MFLLSWRAESWGLQGPPQNEPPSSGQSWGWHSWIRERESGRKGAWPEVQSQKGLAVRPRIWAVIFNTPGRSESTRKNVNQNWRVKGKARSLLCKSRDLVFAKRKLWERSRLLISKTQQVPVCFHPSVRNGFPGPAGPAGRAWKQDRPTIVSAMKSGKVQGPFLSFLLFFWSSFQDWHLSCLCSAAKTKSFLDLSRIKEQIRSWEASHFFFYYYYFGEMNPILVIALKDLGKVNEKPSEKDSPF